MLVKNVIPAIKQKWPAISKRCIIQQDNAKPNITVEDSVIVQAMNQNRIRMELLNQPPNSPEFNVLDLGFFNSIQALQHQYTPKNIDDLVAITEGASADLYSMKLNDVFLSYHLAMESSMIIGGGNSYKLHHIGKANIFREGRLPIDIRCSDEALEIPDTYLRWDTERVVKVIEDGIDEMGESMDYLILSEEDAEYAAVTELEPLQLIQQSKNNCHFINGCKIKSLMGLTKSLMGLIQA